MSFFTSRRQNEVDGETQNQEKSTHIGFDTVLGATTDLEGTLKSEGNIRLDGAFSGKLDITGNVLVGETAQISADIEARNISIAGTVRGNVTGNKVQILRTGRIWGDIQAQSLTTEEGAFIEGNIAMYSSPPPTVGEDGEEVTEIPEHEDAPESATIPSLDELDAEEVDESEESDNF